MRDIDLAMLSHGFPFDSFPMPPTGSSRISAVSRWRVLTEIERQRIAPIEMKSLGGDGRAVKKKADGRFETVQHHCRARRRRRT